jgi:multiple sugar transport system substrate-binding protein
MTSVNKLSTHQKEALEYVRFAAENYAKIFGITPALEDSAAQRESLKQIADASDGSVTVDDLAKAFFDNDLGYVQEKIVGPAATNYSNIILREGGQYLMGKRSLDDTIKAVKEQADAAIKIEKN